MRIHRAVQIGELAVLFRFHEFLVHLCTCFGSYRLTVRGDPLTVLRDDVCIVDVGGQRVCRLGLRLCEGRRAYCEAEESGDH